MIDFVVDNNSLDLVYENGKIKETNVSHDIYIRLFSAPNWWASSFYVGEAENWIDIRLGRVVTDAYKMEVEAKIKSLYSDEKIDLEWKNVTLFLSIR